MNTLRYSFDERAFVDDPQYAYVCKDDDDWSDCSSITMDSTTVVEKLEMFLSSLDDSYNDDDEYNTNNYFVEHHVTTNSDQFEHILSTVLVLKKKAATWNDEYNNKNTHTKKDPPKMPQRRDSLCCCGEVSQTICVPCNSTSTTINESLSIRNMHLHRT